MNYAVIPAVAFSLFDIYISDQYLHRSFLLLQTAPVKLIYVSILHALSSSTGSSRLLKKSKTFHLKENFILLPWRQFFLRQTFHSSPQLRGNLLRYLSTAFSCSHLTLTYQSHWAGTTFYIF